MIVYLTRRERFNAAHRLWVDAWNEEQNLEAFGICANKNYHGHNFNLFVTVKGKPDPITGMIINAKDLGKIIRERITSVLDHTNLDLDPNFFPKEVQTTTENMAYYIWHELVPHLDNCQLHCVKVVETENIYVEYFGE